MSNNRNARSVTTAVVTAVGLTFCAASAVADVPAASGGDPAAISDLPVAVANPGVPAELIESLPEVVQQSDVLIDETFEQGMPIVYPDGTPVEGQDASATRAALESRASCNLSALAPGTGSYGPTSLCSTAVFGHPGYYRGYVWHTGWGITAPRACAQGRGFTPQGTAVWYSVSCGTSTGGDVHWGNILGNPAFRAQSLSVPLSFMVSWTS